MILQAKYYMPYYILLWQDKTRNSLWEYFVKNETFRINEAWDWCENILIVKIHNKRLNKVEACKIVCTCLWFTDQYFISDLKVVVVRSCTKCYIFLCVAFCRNNGLMNWWILYVLWKKKYKKSWKKKISKIIFLAIQLHDQWYDMRSKKI